MFHNFPLFLAAAILLAILPGPGILYVATRSLAAGRVEGVASSLGNSLGCSLQVVAGALGLSALVLASAKLFVLVKLVGAIYLICMGISMIRHAGRLAAHAVPVQTGWRRAFADGVVVELFNPKTAGFFLAILPQFVNPAGQVALQFMILGMISVGLNSCADLTVAMVAGTVKGLAQGRWMARIRRGSGLIMVGLGVNMLFVRRGVS